MLELTGATRRAGHDRRRRRRARPRRPSACARRASRRCSASRSPRDRQAEILRALGFGVAEARRRPRRHRARVPAQRRHARGRPHRGGRADRRPREAARDAARAPRRGRARCRAEQRLRRRADGRARRPRPVRDRRLELHRPRRSASACAWPPTTRAAAPVVIENPMSADHSGHAHDARSARCSTSPAHNAARGMARPRAVRVRHRLPRPAARRCPHEHRALGALLTGRLRAADVGHAASPPRAGFFAAKGAARRGLDALRVDWDVEPGGEPFLHPGRSAQVARRRRDRRLGRRAAPARRRAPGTSTARALFEVDLDRVLDATPTPCRSYRDLTTLPGAARRTSRSSLDDDVPAASVLGTVRAAGGKLLRRRARLRRLPRRAGGGGPQVARPRA